MDALPNPVATVEVEMLITRPTEFRFSLGKSVKITVLVCPRTPKTIRIQRSISRPSSPGDFTKKAQ